MKETNEIEALIRLIDDPDDMVYELVAEKLFSYGKEIIPTLERYWGSVESTETQDRLESIINKLHFRDIEQNVKDWLKSPEDLFEAALLISSIKFPDVNKEALRAELGRIRKDIWLELNHYLTPLEQINIFNSVFYNYYKFKPVEINHITDNPFHVSYALENKKGNAISLGILYVVLCKELNLPVYVMKLPRQFILGYVDEQAHLYDVQQNQMDKLRLFIDASSGQLFSQRDVEAYLKKLGETPKKKFFTPMTNKEIIVFLINELIKCIDLERDLERLEELKYLKNIVESSMETGPNKSE